MFEFSVSKDTEKKKEKNNEKIISTYLLAYLLTLIDKELKISVEHGRLMTTLNIIKH